MWLHVETENMRTWFHIETVLKPDYPSGGWLARFNGRALCCITGLFRSNRKLPESCGTLAAAVCSFIALWFGGSRTKDRESRRTSAATVGHY